MIPKWILRDQPGVQRARIEGKRAKWVMIQVGVWAPLRSETGLTTDWYMYCLGYQVCIWTWSQEHGGTTFLERDSCYKGNDAALEDPEAGESLWEADLLHLSHQALADPPLSPGLQERKHFFLGADLSRRYAQALPLDSTKGILQWSFLGSKDFIRLRLNIKCQDTFALRIYWNCVWETKYGVRYI